MDRVCDYREARSHVVGKALYRGYLGKNKEEVTFPSSCAIFLLQEKNRSGQFEVVPMKHFYIFEFSLPSSFMELRFEK
jgi:hypothetical protein